MDKETLEQMPDDVKVMLFILLKNKMWPVNGTTYTKGRSIDDPIVIGIKENYVRMEYLIAAFLLHPMKNTFILQSLFGKDDKHYDRLDYEVTEEDGSVHNEQFYFDITIGFNAISGR